MKKIVTTLMIVVLLVVSSISGFALNYSTSGANFDSGVFPEINKYLDGERADKSLIGTRATFNISLPVLPFSQLDSDWAYETMDTDGDYIKDSGCALTCVAMVFKYYGANTNPLILNNDLGDYACPIHWYEADNLGSDGNANLIVYDDSPTSTDVMNTCVNALEDGYPVVLGLEKSSGITHYVLVKSLIGSGTSWQNYGVIDPYGGNTNNIQNLLNAGYSFHKLVVYEEL
jgi:hypothetical protein